MVLKAQGKAQHVRYGFMLVISPCVLFTPYLSESNLSWFPPKNLLSCSFLLEEVQSPLACDLCKPTAGNDGQMFRAVPSIVDANPRLHKSVADPSVLSILNWWFVMGDTKIIWIIQIVGRVYWGNQFLKVTYIYIYIYTHRASNHLLLLPESKVNNLLILNSSVTKSRRCANV